MKRIISLIICCVLLGGCYALATSRGTYNDPLMPESTPNEDKQHATVIFYRTDSLLSSAMAGEEWIVFINYDKSKTYYSPSELLVANSKGYSVTKLSPGIYKFSLATLASRDHSAQTAQLKAGETYYLSLVFKHILPDLWSLLNPISALQFTSQDNFLKETDGLSELRITKGRDLNATGWWKSNPYEVVKKK